MKDFYPLFEIAGVPTKKGIKFQHPSREILIKSHTEIVWAVLAACNGVTLLSKVINTVARKTLQPIALIGGIVDELFELGIIVDSRQIYKRAHYLGNNLSPYTVDLSPAEVFALQQSAHLPIPDGSRVSLETPKGVVLELGKNRVSCRSFSNQQITQEELSDILGAAYAVDVRSSPSAGALYPLRLYAVIPYGLSASIVAGIYVYDRDLHELVMVKDHINEQQIKFALNDDFMLHNASVIVVITADLHRQPCKYANRGYRYTLVEAGHVAQTIHLTASELGLSALEYCGFQDKALAQELNIEDGSLAPILSIGLGHEAAPYRSSDELSDRLQDTLVGKNKPINWVHIVNSPLGDDDYSFYHAVSHFRAGKYDYEPPRKTYATRHCGGTGTSSSLAVVKAIAEAYERYRSGVVRVDAESPAMCLDTPWLDPRIYAPYTSLQRSRFLALNEFTESEVIQWVSGLDANNQEVMVPIDIVYYPLSKEKVGRKLCHYTNSNGVAAYTNRVEAEIRAVLELVERDAVLRSWYTKEPKPRVDPGFLSPHWLGRIQYWRAQGFEVDFVDLSHDGITIIMVVIRGRDQYPHFVTGTAASITSLDEACQKAFHEAELSLIVMRDEGSVNIELDEIRDPEDHGKFYALGENQEYLGNIYIRDFCNPSQPYMSRQELWDKYSPVIVDLSPPDEELIVVRALCQDLIPINFGYGLDHYSHHTLPESLRQSRVLPMPHYLA